MKATVKLYIFQRPGEEQRATHLNMSAYPEHYGVLLGIREVEVEVEPFDIDPTSAMIKRLEQETVQVAADAQHRIAQLREQISKLRCLEHKPEAAA